MAKAPYSYYPPSCFEAFEFDQISSVKLFHACCCPPGRLYGHYSRLKSSRFNPNPSRFLLWALLRGSYQQNSFPHHLDHFRAPSLRHSFLPQKTLKKMARPVPLRTTKTNSKPTPLSAKYVKVEKLQLLHEVLLPRSHGVAPKCLGYVVHR